jgi:hypothetical protein
MKLILLEEVEQEAHSRSILETDCSLAELVQETYREDKAADKDLLRTSLSQACLNLRAGKQLTFEEKATVVEYLQRPLGRACLAENISKWHALTHIQSPEALRGIGELLISLLTAFVMQQDYNYTILQTVLTVSKLMYTKVLCDFFIS